MVPVGEKVTWAEKNHGRPLLQPRSRPNQTKRTRAERAIRTEANRQRNEALADALTTLCQTLEEGLQRIATEHHRDIAAVRNMFFYSQRVKSHAKPSLGNALLSFKAEQLNEGTFS